MSNNSPASRFSRPLHALPRSARRLAAFALAAGCLVAPAAADVLVVGPEGSGAQFTVLSAAVVAAQPGDQLRLLPGVYDAAIIDKPLSVVGTSRDEVLLRGGNLFQPGLQVSGLEAGEHVHLASLRVVPELTTGVPGALRVYDCAGAVTVDDVQLGDTSNPDALGSGIALVGAALVIVSDSSVQATDTGGVKSASTVASSPAIQLEDSLLVLERCEVLGGAAGTEGIALSLQQSFGGAGVTALRSVVVLSDAEVSGGRGGALPNASPTGRGGVAVDLMQSRVIVAGGSVLRGGDATFVPGRTTGAGGPAILGVGGSQVRLEPLANLEGGLGREAMVQAPDVELGDLGVLIQESERFLCLHASNAPTSLSFGVELEVDSEPNRVVMPFAALGAAGPFEIPGFDGLSVIDPAAAIALPSVETDAAGNASAAIDAGTDPALAGQAAVFHGWELDAATGSARIGFSSCTTLRP